MIADLSDAHAVAAAIDGMDAVIHIAKVGPDQRVVTSVREITDADGDLVVSNEIYCPDATGRAEPRFPFSADRLARLEDAGLDRRFLTQPGAWSQT